MPEPSGPSSAIPPEERRFPSASAVPLPSLAEVFYQGHLEDLASRSGSEGLEQFIRDIFGAEARLLSDAQKRRLGHQLLVWTAGRSRTIRTRVWKAFAACRWVLPVLEIVETLPREQRSALLDVDARVLVDVIEPYLGDHPGRILPLSGPAIEERSARRSKGTTQPLE